ncbi:unnamed protein product [Cylicocyclus nassatus]|uniref:Carboxylic ester hydrolase n=1 Tax=Cylicocyclus nassatus TaxID=53992 RepID=A0AA36DNV2_CYLNA|nr:unnamed protein product [Cylicocyclus nassatus]
MMLIPLLLWAMVANGATQIITLNPGQVQGFTYTTSSGDVAEIYLGIPYAAPPVGDRRFEKPATVTPWDTVRNGRAFGFSCHPHTREAVQPVASNEDCLTLNIIRPQKQAPPEGFPILFWVHGGGYEVGASSAFGYEGFADIYVPNDVISVTIQYRTGVYGFFSTGDSRIPGNLGLFDMAAALKFVYDNAPNFGGDRTRITVWGLSAGGAAAGQLALSPVSRNYVAGSIEMSGSPWVYWAMGPNVAKHSVELAKELNCTGDDLKRCMKSKSVDQIYDAVLDVGYTQSTLDSVKWGPVLDGEFLTYPDEMVTKAPPKPSIVGVGDKDGTFFTLKWLSPYIHMYGLSPSDYRRFDKNSLVDFLKRMIRPDFYGNETENVYKAAKKYYVDRGDDSTWEFYLDRYTEVFLTDVTFNVPLIDEVVARRRYGSKMYVYSFDHYNDAIWSDDVPVRLRGSPHVNEYPYMFGVYALGNFSMTGKERTVADVVQQSFISFAKTGIPTNNLSAWDEAGEDLRYLSISPYPQMKNAFDQGEFDK